MADNLEQVAHDSARGSFYLGIGNLASTIIQAIGTFIVVRLLGEEQYGIYTLAVTIPTTLISLVNFGINEGIIKYSASLTAENKKERIATLIAHSITFNTIIGILFFLTCFLLADPLATYAMARPQYANYLRLASLIILLQVTYNSANAVFIGLNTMEYSALTSIITATAKTAITTTLVVIGLGVIGTITGLIASWLTASLAATAIVYAKIYRPLKKQATRIKFTENVKTLLKYGLPLYVGTVIVALNSQLQNLILPFFTTDAQIGSYRAAANFTVLINVIPIPIASALLPAFSRLNTKSNRLGTLYKLAVKYISLILLPVAMLLAAFSNLAVTTVYGFTQSPTSTYLILLCLQFLLAGIGSITFTSLFNGIGRTKITLKLQAIGFALSIVLAPIFTQAYGVAGLIIANLITATATTAYAARLAKREANASPDYKTIAKIYLTVLASLALLEAIALIFPLDTLLKATAASLLYLLTYLTLLPPLKILTLQELQNIERILKRTRSLALIAKPFLTYERILLTKTTRKTDTYAAT